MGKNFVADETFLSSSEKDINEVEYGGYLWAVMVTSNNVFGKGMSLLNECNVDLFIMLYFPFFHAFCIHYHDFGHFKQ